VCLKKGNFGEVYHGEYRGNDCVVKFLKDTSPEARAELLGEADMLAQVIR
jgi:predicted Ser/Thr protein kinase